MQSKQIHELLFSFLLYSNSTTVVEEAHCSNHGYGHTSVTPLDFSNESLRLAFPECVSNRHSSTSLQISTVKRSCVLLLLLAVKVLSYIGYLVLDFRRAGFPCKSLLQGFILLSSIIWALIIPWLPCLNSFYPFAVLIKKTHQFTVLMHLLFWKQ